MTVTLKTTLREKVGSRACRKLRLQGMIPCSLQGEGAHVNAAIDFDEFLTARRHHEHVFELALPGGGETAMVRELQYDLVGDHIVHVEFYRVDLAKETEAEVGIEFAGHPKGGVLNHLMTHVTVAAIPAKIPDRIEVYVSELEPGHPLLGSPTPQPRSPSRALSAPTSRRRPRSRKVPRTKAPRALRTSPRRTRTSPPRSSRGPFLPISAESGGRTGR